jgi:hypothetical protein
MRILSACAFSMVLIAGCGGGSPGPTSPAPPANVAGTWSGTSTKTVTAGPACIGRQPTTNHVTAQITQSGAAISGTSNVAGATCSFHGTVSGTTISWAQDAQQANPICLVAYFYPCFANGGITFINVGGQASSIAGTVSGAQISASGSSTDNVYDPATHQVTATVQATLQVTLQRQ